MKNFFANQDNFNKFVTVILLFYSIFMYSWSFAVGKPLDVTGYSVLVAPVITHSIHLISNNFVARNQGLEAKPPLPTGPIVP